jgi:hypothetical protein
MAGQLRTEIVRVQREDAAMDAAAALDAIAEALADRLVARARAEAARRGLPDRADTEEGRRAIATEEADAVAGVMRAQE